jgi:hypothetical protein
MEGAIADVLDWILESPPAWVHFDNQATRTTDLTQTEGGNANDEKESNLIRESSYNGSTIERSEASEAPDRSIVDSSDNDSLSGSAANSLCALNNPRTDQPRVQVARDEATRTLQRLANRPEGYRCACGLPLGHAGLCPFNSTEEARKEVLKGVVVKPMPLVPDVQRLIELHKLHAAGNATRQEQDGGVYNCGNCGPVTRPHPCPFKPCPVCGRRMKDHNNNTFCPNYQRKAITRIRVSRKCIQKRSVIHEAWTKIQVENTRKRRHL